MNLFAIDPGHTRSAFVRLHNDGGILQADIVENESLAEFIRRRSEPEHFAIEMIACYGMPVGKEVFETCLWIGRFIEIIASRGCEHDLVYRKDVKLHLCGNCRAKDPNVRQALIDKYPRTGGGKTPQIGTSKEPGPLYGFSADMWAALGVALTFRETRMVAPY